MADELYVPSDRPKSDPLHLHLSDMWRHLTVTLAKLEGRVLDIGCGLQPYRKLLGPKVTEYVGMDRPGPYAKPDVEGDALNLPFPDASFDSVMSTQVLEHVTDPMRAMKAAARVLKPGGRLALTAPGCWPHHEVPHDYWRFTRFGLEHLLRESGFSHFTIEAQGGTWSTLGQMFALELIDTPFKMFIPMVNRMSRYLDRRGAREELVTCWTVLAQRS